MMTDLSATRLLRPAWAMAIAMLLLAGCTKAPTQGTVEGKVTFNGAPFSNARLNFISQALGTAATADIQADGTYNVASPLKPGSYKVFLLPKEMGDPDHPKAATGPDTAIPQKYWSEATSDLKAEVKEGKNQVPIELKK